MKSIPIIIGIVLMFTLAACNNEENQIYTSRERDECKTLQFTCATGRAPFYEEEGCGCELIEEVEIQTDTESYEFNRDENELINPNNRNNTQYRNDPTTNQLNESGESSNRINEDPPERNLDEIQDQRLQDRD